MPPSTTAPAPSSSQAPAPSPSGAGSTVPAGQGSFPASEPAQPPKEETSKQPVPLNDALSEIDKLIADTQQKTPPPPGARRQQEALARQKAEAEAKEKADGNVKGQEKPAETTPPAADESQTLKAPELRAAYKAKKAEAADLSQKYQQAEARIKELEAKVGDGSQLTKVQQMHEAAQKRIAELEEAIKFSDYEKSPEYKEKYHAPFVEAYSAGRNKVGSLKVIERSTVDEATGEKRITQPGRKATPEDFDALMRVSDDGEAAMMADQLFGPMANLVMYHREKVLDLNGSRAKAIEDFRKQGGEREQQFAAQTQAMQERAKQIYHQAVQTGVEKHPQWFKPEDGDDQGKQMIEKGLANVDLLFSDNKLAPEQLAVAHAALRNMAGHFPYLALKLHRVSAERDALREELKQYKESEPTKPSSERPSRASAVGYEEELDALSAQNR